MVNTKKTDRDRDYLVIQLLAEMVFEQAKKDKRSRASVITWLVKESRNAGHLKNIAKTWDKGQETLLNSKRPAAVLAARNADIANIQKELDLEREQLKKENKEYWRPLIAELRQLRKKLKLRTLIEGLNGTTDSA